MQRYCTLKSELDRLSALERCFGRRFEADVLDARDRLCLVHPAVEPFLSDIILVAAMERFGLTPAGLDALTEADVLRIVAWGLVTLPLDKDCTFADALDAPLQQMARLPVEDSAFPGLPHTLLMRALHHHAPGSLPHGDIAQPGALLRWFYLEAVPRHRLHRCVGPSELAALNAGRPMHGFNLLSVLDFWALQTDPNATSYDFTSATGQIQAREAAYAMREADPAFAFYRSPLRPRQAGSAHAGRRLTVPGIGLSRMAVETYRLRRGEVRSFGGTCTGNGLLLAEEWGHEEAFAWALAPVATLVFALEGEEPGRGQGAALPRAFGFSMLPYPAADTMNQELSVFLNGVRILTMPVATLLSQDAVVSDDVPFVPGMNQVQFAVDVPLIPAVMFGSHDTRALGIALRRIWLA